MKRVRVGLMNRLAWFACVGVLALPISWAALPAFVTGNVATMLPQLCESSLGYTFDFREESLSEAAEKYHEAQSCLVENASIRI